jgi:hypothetical protein
MSDLRCPRCREMIYDCECDERCRVCNRGLPFAAVQGGLVICFQCLFDERDELK